MRKLLVLDNKAEQKIWVLGKNFKKNQVGRVEIFFFTYYFKIKTCDVGWY